jgi:very-short-patch-repair endonuclease
LLKGGTSLEVSASREKGIEPTLAKGAANEVSGGFVRPYNKMLKQFSRTLRSNMTDAEQHLWQRLRNKQVSGVLFYRQKPLLSFIVDFYCPTAKLVVELDGVQHLEAEHQIKDAARDEELAKLGVKVMRFDDRQVLRETDAVVAAIYEEMVARLESSNLP